jgi:hypothetical protein
LDWDLDCWGDLPRRGRSFAVIAAPAPLRRLPCKFPASPNWDRTWLTSGALIEPSIPAACHASLTARVSARGSSIKTGHVDRFDLTPDAAGQRYLRGRLKARGPIVIVLVPGDVEVAATYFGVGSEPEANRPRLVVELGTAK